MSTDEGALDALEKAGLTYLDDVYPHWRDEPGALHEPEVRGAIRAALAQAAEVTTEYGVRLTVDGVTSMLCCVNQNHALLRQGEVLARHDPRVVEREVFKTGWRLVWPRSTDSE
jgi:hypothetical protein